MSSGGSSSGLTYLADRKGTVLLGAKQNDFFSVGSIQLRKSASSRLALHNLRRGVTHVIGSGDFVNVWMYGMDIILTGYLSGSELRYHLASSRRPGPPSRSQSPACRVRVRDLKPLADLFEDVKAWHAARAG